jgi:hypothetical protein
VISIVGSYDCYYLVRRHDGSNTSFEGLDYATIVRQADEIVQMILRETSPGPLQVHLVARHVRVELLRRFNYHFGAKPAEEQQSMVDIAQPYAAAWDVPGLLLELSVPERLLLLAVRSGDGPRTAEVVAWTLRGNRAPVVADEGRWLLAGPGFRTEHDDDVFALKAAPSPTVRIEQLSLAAGVLTVVGSAHFRGIDSTCSEVSLVARHADSGRELAATTSRLPSPHVNAMDGGGGVSYADAGFRATFALDDDDLAQGEWRLAVCLRAGDLAEERPVRRLEGFRKSSWKSPQHVAVLRAEQGNVVLAVRRKGSATQPTDTGLTQRLRTRLRRSN